MQREIKFKAAVKDNYGNIMILPVSFDKDNIYFIRDEGGIHSYHCSSLSLEDSRILGIIQYTGLKDKNGKEIYEGDLLKSGDRVAEVVRQDAGMRLHMLQQNSIDVSNSNLLSLNQDSMTFWEVVGNTFEEFPLLTETKWN